MTGCSRWNDGGVREQRNVESGFGVHVRCGMFIYFWCYCIDLLYTVVVEKKGDLDGRDTYL